jgi:hypothetical protein
MREYFYIAGNDCAVRRSGKVKQQEVFDGPHNSPEDAHSVAKDMIVAGEYDVLTFDTPDRDKARQQYNHNIALKIGAGAATANKMKLQPTGTSQKDVVKREHDDAYDKFG